MLRADSPSSMLSHNGTIAPEIMRKPVGQKPAYRLFPAVEPTPPASPMTSQKANLQSAKATESPRRRSISLDDTLRSPTAVFHDGAHRQVSVRSKRGRKGSMSCDVKPMSTVQEIPQDSPTVPNRFTFRSGTTTFSDDSGHGRSSSAPNEYLRDSVAPSPLGQHVTSTIYQNQHAAFSTQTVNGLGLRLDSSVSRNQQSPASGRQRRPSIQIRSNRDKDLPPPPPPKSPRHRSRTPSIQSMHSRSSSAQSQISTRDVSPIAVAQTVSWSAVRPTFVTNTSSRSSSPAGVRTASVRVPPTLPPASQAQSAFGTDTRLRELMDKLDDKRGRVRKPVPLVPTGTIPKTPSGPLSPPSSKFSTRLPTPEPDADGEKTPRANTQVSGTKAAQTSHVNVNQSSDSLLLPEDSTRERGPPTPRKDSFYSKGKGEESFLRSLKDPEPQAVTKQSEVSSAKDMNRAAKAEQHPVPPPPTRPSPPAPTTQFARRIAPNRAPSPQITLQPAPPPRSRGGTEHAPPFRAVTPDLLERPTPELPTHGFNATKLSPQAHADPLDTLRDLSAQTEALHARYARLRSDRQKLSTSIIASLKEQKAGPEYSNTLLDQHLCLAAINSSMDICFAKLKSLDCRKEEAMVACRTEAVMKKRVGKKAASLRSKGSFRSHGSRPATPDILIAVTRERSANRLGEDGIEASPQPTPTEQERTLAPPKEDAIPEIIDERRATMIKYSPKPDTPTITAEPDGLPPPPPKPDTIPIDVDSDDLGAAKPKHLRIKGAKAAKILGLVKEAALDRPGSPMGITLPDGSEEDLRDRSQSPIASRLGAGPSIEISIPDSRLSIHPLHLRSPAPTTPLPMLPARKDTSESSTSAEAPSLAAARSEAGSRAGSSTSTESSSSPEEEDEEKVEVATPREGLGNVVPGGGSVVAAKSLELNPAAANTGMKVSMGAGREVAPLSTTPQTLQVWMDDDVDEELLDYYHGS